MKHIVRTEHKWSSTGWDCKICTELKSASYFLWEDKINPIMVAEGVIPQTLYTVAKSTLFGPKVLYQGRDISFAERLRESINEGNERKLEELNYSHGNNPEIIRATMDDWREAKHDAIFCRSLPTLPDHVFTLSWEDEGPIVAKVAVNESDDCLLFLSSERGPAWNYPRHDVILSPEETTAQVLRSLIFPKSMALVTVLQKEQRVAIRIQGEYEGWDRWPGGPTLKKHLCYNYIDMFTWNGKEIVKTSTKPKLD